MTTINNVNIVNNIDDIESYLKNNDIMLIKFDNINSSYDQYISKLNYKIINITDTEIIDFYDISTLPTILIYKNKNLIDSIEGFLPKSSLETKINLIINQ